MSKTDEFLSLSLKCLLTDDEKMERGAALAEHVQAIEVLSKEKSASAAGFKTRIDHHTLEGAALSFALKNGYEYRDVACSATRNFEVRTVTIVRIDTGECIETRPMEIHEMQSRLFDEDVIGSGYADRHQGKITVLGK